MSRQDSPQFSVPGIQWRSGTRQLGAGIMGTMEVGLGTQAGAGRKDGTGRLHQQLQISPGIRESADKLIQVQLKENNTRIAFEIALLFITHHTVNEIKANK